MHKFRSTPDFLTRNLHSRDPWATRLHIALWGAPAHDTCLFPTGSDLGHLDEGTGEGPQRKTGLAGRAGPRAEAGLYSEVRRLWWVAGTGRRHLTSLKSVKGEYTFHFANKVTFLLSPQIESNS